MSDSMNGGKHPLRGLYDSPFVRRVAVTLQIDGISCAHVQCESRASDSGTSPRPLGGEGSGVRETVMTFMIWGA